MKIEEYEHHGNNVKVRSDLKGKHRSYCLCWICNKFKPEDRENNCPIANDTYENCIKNKLVTPVWECPEFEEKPLDVKVKDRLTEIILTLPQVACFMLECAAPNLDFAEKANAILREKRALSILTSIGAFKSDDFAIGDNVLLFPGRKTQDFVRETGTRFEIVFLHDLREKPFAERVVTNTGKIFYVSGDGTIQLVPFNKRPGINSYSERVTKEEAQSNLRTRAI